MKLTGNKKWVAVGAVLAAGAGAFFYFYHPASAAVGNLDIYSGGANVARGGATIMGASGTGINLSDMIIVAPGSRVSIILKDGTEVRLEAGTEIAVSDITYHGAKLAKAILDLHSGEAWSHVSPLAAGGTFEVETPTVVATVRGTNFDVAYHKDAASTGAGGGAGGVSTVYVGTHSVWVSLRSDPANVARLNAGNSIVIHDANAANDFAAGPQSNFLKYDWIFFNENLDQSISTAPTSTAPMNPPKQTLPLSPKPAPKPAPVPAPTSTPQATPQGAGSTLRSLTLAVQNETINQNDVDPLTVTATYSDGATAVVTSKVTWKESVAGNIIDTQGNLHAAFTGDDSIAAILNGITSNTVLVAINQAVAPQPVPVKLTAISIACQKNQSSPAANYMLPGAQCAATGSYSNNTTEDVTTQVAWSIQGTAGGAIDTKGNYVPRNEGSATISAALNGITGSTQLTIP